MPNVFLMFAHNIAETLEMSCSWGPFIAAMFYSTHVGIFNIFFNIML